MVTISTDDHHTLQEFRASVGANWTFLSDPGRIIQKNLDIQEYTDPEHDPMARLAILGSRGIPAKYGAFEVAAERIGRGLLEKGWDVTVFCPHYQAYRDESYEGLTLRYVWHPPGGAGSLFYDGLSLLLASVARFDRG